MLSPVKLWFTDFWFPHAADEPFFFPLLKQHFKVILDPKPDVLIHSVFGKTYLKYPCTRVGYTAENTRPDFKHSDYYIGFDHLQHPDYLRWPNFLTYYKPEAFCVPRKAEILRPQKTKFCSFIVSNGQARERIDFFNHLNALKKVDSGGKLLNNLGYCVDHKLSFIRDYKFTIAFENSAYPGYTTEKIYEPFMAHSVPIYWGNPDVAKDFHPDSFIDARNFKDLEELSRYVLYLDEDEAAYARYLEAPCFLDNKVPSAFQEDKVIAFFENIFSQLGKRKPVARVTDYYIFGQYALRVKMGQWRKKTGI